MASRDGAGVREGDLADHDRTSARGPHMRRSRYPPAGVEWHESRSAIGSSRSPGGCVTAVQCSGAAVPQDRASPMSCRTSAVVEQTTFTCALSGRPTLRHPLESTVPGPTFECISRRSLALVEDVPCLHQEAALAAFRPSVSERPSALPPGAVLASPGQTKASLAALLRPHDGRDAIPPRILQSERVRA
jgi:hypothetical protein